MSLTVGVEVPPRDREVLAGWLRAPSLPAGLVQRARIVLLGREIGGFETSARARAVGVPPRAKGLGRYRS
jgi:hypothetical protein